jgi:hypothetical protein
MAELPGGHCNPGCGAGDFNQQLRLLAGTQRIAVVPGAPRTGPATDSVVWKSPAAQDHPGTTQMPIALCDCPRADFGAVPAFGIDRAVPRRDTLPHTRLAVGGVGGSSDDGQETRSVAANGIGSAYPTTFSGSILVVADDPTPIVPPSYTTRRHAGTSNSYVPVRIYPLQARPATVVRTLRIATSTTGRRPGRLSHVRQSAASVGSVRLPEMSIQPLSAAKATDSRRDGTVREVSKTRDKKRRGRHRLQKPRRSLRLGRPIASDRVGANNIQGG